MKESVFEQAAAFFFKIILPPLVGVSVKVAIIMQKEKVSVVRILLAYVIGIGMAWLSSPVIFSAVGKEWAPMILAIVAITGDKLGEYFIYKMNVDGLLTALFEYFLKNLKKK